MAIGPKQVATAAAVLAVVYPVGYFLWLRLFEPAANAATVGLLILIADFPFVIAGVIWLVVRFLNPPPWPAAERLFLQHPTLIRVAGAAVVVATIAVVRLIWAP